ncbi:MAG: hypothetical protein K0U68_11405 [Gammaproteobacteria bacterium]|nr:hypothetical protein [Gammaproteobacteria bacterium]
MKSWLDYPAELYVKARAYYWGNILVAPVIWSVLLPAMLLDLFVTVYHAVCFPVYGIPRVNRRDYIVMDRGRLKYLSWDEKLSCLFCGYFNGLLAYCAEIASRTEQYWCPIKHRKTPKSTHKRYQLFLDYGDGDNYLQRLDEQRNIVREDQV